MQTKKRFAVRVAPAVLVLALAACGGGGSDAEPTAAGGGATQVGGDVSGQDAMIEFTRCMREQGVDMPDPGSDGRVMIGPDDLDTGSEEFEAAQEACGDLLDAAVGAGGGSISPELQDRFLALTRCMREKGFDMPDPQFGEGGRVEIGGGSPSFDPGDPAFREANEACSREVGMPQPGGAQG